MVCFCPYCGGNDVNDDGVIRFDGEDQYRCGDCHRTFAVQLVALSPEEEELNESQG